MQWPLLFKLRIHHWNRYYSDGKWRGFFDKNRDDVSNSQCHLCHLLPWCGKSYIGETGEQLNKRACGHRTQIFNPNYRALEVCHHIAECGGSDREGPPPFSIAPFFKMPATCTRIEREGKEKNFFRTNSALAFTPVRESSKKTNSFAFFVWTYEVILCFRDFLCDHVILLCVFKPLFALLVLLTLMKQ